MSDDLGCADGDSDPVVPAIQKADIEWVEATMGLTFDAARRDVLLSNECFDVQACPGGGKTTLLVAKLAILARHWKHAHRGLCVLTHTNVARQEIESRLAGSIVSGKLLDYPHFVGTIQAFVDEFLAIPMLKSEGGRVTQIDNDVHGTFCKRLLAQPKYSKCRFFLAKNDTRESIIVSLQYVGADLEISTKSSLGLPSEQSPSGKALREIKRTASANGIWRYDDMFAWAERLVKTSPVAVRYLRQRFPIVIMDEAQDTDALQSRILAKVFPVSDCHVRQRYGDRNQAIYDYNAGKPEECDDPFPSGDQKSVPTSKRFGRSIADKARAVAPKPDLVGEGPARVLADAPAPDAIKHTVFTFPSNSPQLVIPAFGELLLRTFSGEVIAENDFVARAIGRVGKKREPDSNSPRHIGEYWADYAPRRPSSDSLPSLMAGYVHLARRRLARARDTREATNHVFRGLVALVEQHRPDALSRGPSSGWRIRTALRDYSDASVQLNSLLWDWCVGEEDVTEASWNESLTKLKSALAPLLGDDWDPMSDSFCTWSDELAFPTLSSTGSATQNENCYVHKSGGRQVPIYVGTIHSAKGQTHTATLVLDTYYNKKHELKDLLDWITATQQGSTRATGKERVYRMRLIYTAMTRPSHLLCLAMRRDFLGEPGPDNEVRQGLTGLGWSIIDLGT